MKSLLLAAIGLATTVATALPTPNAQEDAAYRRAYPYFADGCSSGRRVDRAGTQGQAWGHGGVYLRGACLDTSAAYPKIKLDCPAGNDGIGLSADGQFRNINWVGIPGENLYFSGDLPRSDVLTPAIKTALIDRLINSGLFNSAQSRKSSDPDVVVRLNAIITEAIPIDVAMTWGRETMCQRVPMNRKQMEAIVAHYNETNRFYYEDGHLYTWSFLKNNCGHTSHNAFAAAGIMRRRETEDSGFSLPFNMVIPSNFFLGALRVTSHKEFPSVFQVYGDMRESRNLVELNMMEVQAGSLTRYLPVHGLENGALNQIYVPEESHTQFLDIRPIDGNKEMLETALSNPRYNNLRANLQYFAGVYSNALQATERAGLAGLRRQIAQARSGDRGSSRRSFRNDYSPEQVYAAYVSYLREKLAETRANLQAL